MGAHRKQGWCLFAFLLGFLLVPAGIIGYVEANATFWGALAVAAGAALLVAAGFGFAVIKPLEHEEAKNPSPTSVPEIRAEAVPKVGPRI